MKEITINLKQLKESNLELETYIVLQMIYEEKIDELKEIENSFHNSIKDILAFLSSNLYVYGNTLDDVTIRGIAKLTFEGTDRAVIEVIEYFNKVADKKFSTKSPSNRRFIRGRLAQGYSIEDCKKVIDIMTGKWKNDHKMKEFLRIETLFNDTKFQGYINQINPTEENVSFSTDI